MENVTVEIKEYEGNKRITVLWVKGFLDTNTAPELDSQLQSALRDKKFNLIIDLSGVDYISSAGWGIFISEIKRIRTSKGDLVLSGMSPGVTEIFELLEFNSILSAFPDPETAAQKAFPKIPRISRELGPIPLRHH